ncbi:MAG: hypothetical protein QNJ46_21625 [Leptolyngbyaceae cyanobacterium MO_188.B28]|nr:hypothetical protein [Leptolyngbyaceae cyanobacterium MO_188.B28]
MKHLTFMRKATAAGAAIFAGLLAINMASADNHDEHDYEIWGSDQSNSVAGVESRGVSGSWIWVWDSKDVERQLTTGKVAEPLGCDGENRPGDGPCNVYEVFPSSLIEYDDNGPTGNSLGTTFGRLHGMLPDPQNQYMNANLFSPGGGYVGIIDGETKEAVALFRVTGTNAGRSVHMSFWNSDGSALLVANLHGKVLERIDVARDEDGKIIDAVFNQSAALGVGKDMAISDRAKVYLGMNSHGNPMLGGVSGSYDTANAFGELTPQSFCKENGCETGPSGEQGGRVNNVIICPIVSKNDNAYITFGGGGLLVANTKTTPMTIVGEYDNQVINGAGCGGVQAGDQMWLNAGVSASGAGAEQSTFTLFTLDDSLFGTTSNAPNTPAPTMVFKDLTNTATIGNLSDNPANTTGQLPDITTRRDSHGMALTLSGSHVHTVDRIQNNVEVFNTSTLERTTYDLTSADGQGNGLGVCAAVSVTDDDNLPSNDPAPDLLETTPDGKYMVVALRGPVPVSVTHAAQGSCPGVGIIEILDDGASGRLAGVLRTTNTIDSSSVSAPGGHPYTGSEHSDVHGASIRKK